jgi:hypothetical protein
MNKQPHQSDSIVILGLTRVAVSVSMRGEGKR